MKMIDHNHFICHLILGTFTEYPSLKRSFTREREIQRDDKLNPILQASKESSFYQKLIKTRKATPFGVAFLSFIIELLLTLCSRIVNLQSISLTKSLFYFCNDTHLSLCIDFQ